MIRHIFSRGQEQPAPQQDRPKCSAAILRFRLKIEEEASTLAEAQTGEATPVTIATGSLACSACHDTASMLPNGRITADSCISTGSCELSWADIHAEQYRDDNGRLLLREVPCGGFKCGAVIRLKEDERPEAIGDCTVTVAGEDFRLNGHSLLNNMPLADPEDGFEPFDGQR